MTSQFVWLHTGSYHFVSLRLAKKFFRFSLASKEKRWQREVFCKKNYYHFTRWKAYLLSGKFQTTFLTRHWFLSVCSLSLAWKLHHVQEFLPSEKKNHINAKFCANTWWTFLLTRYIFFKFQTICLTKYRFIPLCSPVVAYKWHLCEFF